MSDFKNLATIQPRDIAPVNYSFNEITRMAQAFAKSGLFGVKDENQALALMLHAQATGKHPATIMRDYDLINNRLAKKAEAMLRDFQASGGRVDWIKYADDGVTGVFTHPFAPKPVTIDWDIERAKKAGLAGKAGDMYSKYTRAMFRSRVISEGVRTTAPEATEQMYTPDEIRAIEVEQVAQTENNAIAGAVAQITHGLSQDDADALVMTMDVKALPELKTAFAAAWKAANGDEKAQARLKSVYDQHKADLEAQVVI
jgi:hypothetical protein